MTHEETIEIGRVFERLVVVAKLRYRGRRHYRCRCFCGNEVLTRSYELKSGRVRSCGCLRRDQSLRHGGAIRDQKGRKTPEYKAWESMKRRCSNPMAQKFYLWGGRGIKVCAEWENDFAAFFTHLGARPSPKHSLDRYPDNDGDYEPGNVRWATAKQQRNNRRETGSAQCYINI
jgi:hypothetical protein